MKNPFPNTVHRTLLTVPVAAMMLGASQSQAVTSIGINFWGSYYTASYSQSGRVVSDTAFGVPAADWTTSYTPTDPDPANWLYDSYVQSGSFVAGPVSVVYTTQGNWVSDINSVNSPAIAPGDSDVLNGFIYGGGTFGPGGAPGFAVNLSGLAAAFPNGYVIQAMTGVDNGTGIAPLTVTDGTTTDTLAYGPFRTTGTAAKWAFGTMSSTFNSDTLTLSGPADQGGLIRSFLSGFVITDKLLVTDVNPPAAGVVFGGTITLDSGVIGIGTLTYQWRHDGVDIPGATAATYTIASAAAEDTGSYDVVVTSSAYPGAPVTNVARSLTVATGIQLWTGVVNGNWDVFSTANWSVDDESSTFDPNPAFQAIFDATATTRDVVLNTAVSPSLTVFDGGSDYTLTGAGSITGTGNVVKSGTGKLTVTNKNSQSGGLTVSGGILQLGDLPTTNYGSVGLFRGTINVETGATLQLQGSNAFGYGTGSKVNAVNLNGATLTHAANEDNGWGVAYALTGSTMQTTGPGQFSLGNTTTIHTLASSDSSVLAGRAAIRDNPSGFVVITTDDGPAAIDFDVTAVLANQGSNGVKKDGAGLMRLTTRATYPGGTVVDGGTLQLGDLPGTDYAGTGLIRGNVTVNSGGILLLQSSNAFGYGDGVKVNAVTLNGGTLTHAGDADNGWGVAYTLNGGFMQITGAGHFSFGNNTSVTTLEAEAASTIAGTVVMREGNSNNVVTFTVADGAAAEDLIVSAALSGGFGRGITKAGAGLMFLTGVCTYTGPTNITGGTLKVASAFFPDDANISMTFGAVLDLQTGTNDAVGGLFIDGQAQPGGVYGAIGSGVQFPVDYITGTGTLTVPPNNPYTLWVKAPPYNLTGNNALPEADPDGDGIINLIEFIIGGNPATGNDSALLPVVSSVNQDWGSGPTDYLVFTYYRTAGSSFLPPRAEYSSDLENWDTAITDTDGVVEVVNGQTATLDSVDVYIPKTLGTGGKLFVRLAAPIPTP